MGIIMLDQRAKTYDRSARKRQLHACSYPMQPTAMSLRAVLRAHKEMYYYCIIHLQFT